MKFCPEHDSMSAALCANFQKDLLMKIEVIEKKFQFQMDFRRIVQGSFCVQ